MKKAITILICFFCIALFDDVKAEEITYVLGESGDYYPTTLDNLSHGWIQDYPAFGNGYRVTFYYTKNNVLSKMGNSVDYFVGGSEF